VQLEWVRSTTIKLYDSGISHHILPSCDYFMTYQSIPPIPIRGANRSVFYAVETGNLRIEVPDGESSTPIILQDVLYMPNVALTVISVDQISQARYLVTFKDRVCKILKKGRTVIGTIPQSMHGIYKVECVYAATIAPECASLHLLHWQLIDDYAPLICNSCEHMKSMHKPIRKEHKALLAKAFRDEVHSNLWGPVPVQSMGKRKYYITFTDDTTYYTRLTALHSKDKALNAYKDFTSWANTQHGMHIKHLCSDHGGEYTSSEFTKFLKEQGTECCLTTHDMPQHNGIMELLNCHLMEHVCTLLHQSGLPAELWAEVLQFIVWVKN
jgi:hypothetical protein